MKISTKIHLAAKGRAASSIFFLLALLLGSLSKPAHGQDSLKVVYKQIDSLSLNLRIYYPPNTKKKNAAMIFFFGGGWNGGSYTQFLNQAKYFASRGLITILADYRVASRNKTSPFEAVMDAKSAIRYLRENKKELHIDGKKIIAAGGSAGGHLAAAADLTQLDEPGEDLKVSSRPNALVLFNPVYNNGPGQYGYDRIGDRYMEISPYHNIRKGAAPTIVFLGTQDKLIPVAVGEMYRDKLKSVGSRSELYLFEGMGHGFFNKGEPYTETVRQADRFLESLGYIKGPPTIK
ncbi:acetyl esterase/lipase [Dyadobacter jejuensis]|uniref:Acetyl esterase/lipase n=1 Tax=Dyadobacter jejuensis TaxID=1082580 RepID=A0A316APU1_9BACT|nr:alpha/beta hydrolase [Dyadobacter jejuensis]PWJ59501.1 acetyl esterase/lipase [Dyadobacter jejuensis]